MLTGVLVLLGVYALVLGLHLVVPGRWVDGYLRDAEGRPYRYHLNGLRVFVLVVGGYALACQAGLLPWDLFWQHRWVTLGTAFVVGLLFTGWIVLGAAPVRGLLADLYLGRIADPRWLGGRLDAKMFLYLVGATMLALNLVSFTAHHVALYGAQASPGMFLHLALFGFFLMEYLWFEEVHLYTYDFVAERVGFKLGWGCLVFYPFFYAVGAWSVAELPPPSQPTWALVLAGLVFVGGWVLARGANMQKFYFKTRPTAPAFGWIQPEALGGRILVNGWWGLSRHINYLGELGMATGLVLSLGHLAEPGPWLYPLYYVALLVPRQLADDRRCAEKYGALWADYTRRVPSRIVPWIY